MDDKSVRGRNGKTKKIMTQEIKKKRPLKRKISKTEKNRIEKGNVQYQNENIEYDGDIPTEIKRRCVKHVVLICYTWPVHETYFVYEALGNNC